MIILLLALLFGIVVGIFTIASLKKAKDRNDKRKLLRILKFAVLAESLVFVVLFIIVIVKTMFM